MEVNQVLPTVFNLRARVGPADWVITFIPPSQTSSNIYHLCVTTSPDGPPRPPASRSIYLNRYPPHPLIAPFPPGAYSLKSTSRSLTPLNPPAPPYTAAATGELCNQLGISCRSAVAAAQRTRAEPTPRCSWVGETTRVLRRRKRPRVRMNCFRVAAPSVEM